jgi:hypothetical protein
MTGHQLAKVSKGKEENAGRNCASSGRVSDIFVTPGGGKAASDQGAAKKSGKVP